MIDLQRLRNMHDCKLWIQNPLADVEGLENASFIPQALEEDLTELEQRVLKDWQCIEGELARTGLSQQQALEQKKTLERFATKTVHYVYGDHLCTDARKPELRLERGTDHRYYSPARIQEMTLEMATFIPIAHLKKDLQFCDNTTYLKEHFKKEYVLWSSDGKVPIIPVYDHDRIQKLLSKKGLVQKKIISNVALLRQEIPFYKAAYARRQAAATETARRLGDKAKNQYYAKPTLNTIGLEWAGMLLNDAYAEISKDPVLCSLVNLQKHKVRDLSDWYAQHVERTKKQYTLTREDLDKCIHSHKDMVSMEFAATGQYLHGGFAEHVLYRLDEFARTCARKNKGLEHPALSAEDHYLAYHDATKRLDAILDHCLLEFTSRIARAPARSK